jgi:hypothetical protein
VYGIRPHALFDGEDRGLALITPAHEAEEPFCLLSWWGGVCAMEEDDEESHVAIMAELLRNGTRVLCRSVKSRYRHQSHSHWPLDLTLGRGFAQGGWILELRELAFERKIGMGSVGAVHKGTHIASGRVVAVKVREPQGLHSSGSYLRDQRAVHRTPTFWAFSEPSSTRKTPPTQLSSWSSWMEGAC